MRVRIILFGVVGVLGLTMPAWCGEEVPRDSGGSTVCASLGTQKIQGFKKTIQKMTESQLNAKIESTSREEQSAREKGDICSVHFQEEYGDMLRIQKALNTSEAGRLGVDVPSRDSNGREYFGIKKTNVEPNHRLTPMEREIPSAGQAAPSR